MPSPESLVLDWPRAFGFDDAEVRAADGTRLRVVVGGPRDGRRIVLVHGAPQLSYEWRRVMPELAGRYRVIAPDLRGYGASELAASGRYDLDTLVDDLRAVVEATRPPPALGASDPDRVLLVAHDWGGPIAWRYAETWPASVRHLVAANAPHPAAYALELAHPRQALRSWYVALFQVPGLERLIERTGGRPLLWMMTSSAPPSTFGADDLAVYRAALARPGRAEAVLAYYRQAFGPPPGSRRGGLGWALRRRAEVLASGRVSAPATIVWGEKDRALAPSHPLATRRWAARLEVRTLPDAGHWLPEERPDEIVRAILDGDAAG
jgi:pimeloyl-ACP methyl ester carboxylesterase